MPIYFMIQYKSSPQNSVTYSVVTNYHETKLITIHVAFIYNVVSDILKINFSFSKNCRSINYPRRVLKEQNKMGPTKK